MNYRDTEYYRVGSSKDLQGSDRALYRMFEIIPGAIAWATILLTLFLSYRYPVYASVLLIAFNLYWVLKSFYLSMHLRQNWKHMRYNMALDWTKRLEPMKAAADSVFHLVIFPFYKESPEVIEKSIASILASTVDPKRVAIVLAGEARAGEESLQNGIDAEKKFAGKFGYFIRTTHPADLPGDIPGKGSNIAYACAEAKRLIVDAGNIPVDRVMVSAFDIDTIVYPQYFACLEWHFLTAPDPYRVSYQPVPLYNNNMDAPALSRVVATSGSFWQMIQQERPERLTTFSSHSMTLKALIDTDYWQRNIVSEDSRIFWNAFGAYDGKYGVVPLAYPVSMDANLAGSFSQTLINVYLQQRRWSWGVENLPYMLLMFFRNPQIPLSKKIRLATLEIERAWSLATNPLLLFILAWFPVILGGHHFNTTVLSYNMPVVSKYLSLVGTVGILVSAWISLSFLPPPPSGVRAPLLSKAWMFIQWFFIPVTLIVFGAIPAMDAQTRMMLGGRFRLGFWVTPKHRK